MRCSCAGLTTLLTSATTMICAPRSTSVFLVQRHHELALEVQSLTHAIDHVRIDQRCGPLGVGQVLLTEVVQSLTVATGAAERHGGLESGGDQHADLRTLVLDQRVGPQRGGVTNRIDLGQDRLEFEAQNLVGLAQRLIEAKRQIVVNVPPMSTDMRRISTP